jgi:magnesium transporter
MKITTFNRQGFSQADALDWERLVNQRYRDEDGDGFPDEVVWIDVCRPLSEEDQALLRDKLGIHPLVIEDMTSDEQRGKIEEYDDGLFLIVNPIHVHDDDVEWNELDIYLTRHYIVTARKEDEIVVQEAIKRVCDPKRHAEHYTGFLMYVLLDTVVDNYLPIIDRMTDRLEEIEEAIISRPQAVQLEQLRDLKHEMNIIWRAIWPQQQVFTFLTHHNHGETSLLADRALEYYLRDVHDHLTRLTEIMDNMRDSLTGTLSVYMSSTSNRLGVVVNRLSIITIAIGVLTVISGFYGMNFNTNWPSFAQPNGVLIVLGMMLVAEVALFGFLAWRRWLR